MCGQSRDNQGPASSQPSLSQHPARLETQLALGLSVVVLLTELCRKECVENRKAVFGAGLARILLSVV